MHLRFNFDACPMHSPSGFVHLTHQNLSARALLSKFTRKSKYAVINLLMKHAKTFTVIVSYDSLSLWYYM